jgi:hypothetical protein
MNKQLPTSRTVARGAPAAAVPRPVAFTRGLFVLGGLFAGAYVWLAMIELRGASGVRDVIVYATGLALVATVTMLPFAVLARQARPWARTAMIATCTALIMLVVILVGADAATLQAGAVRVAAWFLALHYVTAGFILVAAIGGLVGLTDPNTAEYFRRRQRTAADDPRLWSVSQLRQLQLARAEAATLSHNGCRSATSVVALDVVSRAAAGSREPVTALAA